MATSNSSPAAPRVRRVRSVHRFEGWYGVGYNRVMRKRWLRRPAYALIGGAPWLCDLDAFVDRVAAAHPNGGTMLDVPCGEGVLERLLRTRTWSGRVIALDLASRAVERTRSIPVEYELDVVRGSALDMPLDDASIDTLVSINGLHCLPDPDAFLREAARVLRAGGSAWLTTITTGRGVRRRMLIHSGRTLGVLPGTPPTREELHSMIADAGLRIAEDLGGSTFVALRLTRA